MDSSAGVPVNSELRVAFTGYGGDDQSACEPNLNELRIEPEPRTGEAINVVGAWLLVDGTSYPTKWMVAKPTQPLRPNQRYSLLSRVSPDGHCACEGDPGFGAWHSVGEFVTDSDVDTQAPALDAEVIQLRYGELRRGDNSCGPFHMFVVELVAPIPEEAWRQTRYNLYLDGELHMRYVKGGASLPIECRESGGGFAAEGRELEVRLVDLAGNESVGKTFKLRDLCAGKERDGASAGDAGEVKADGGPAESADGSSCSASAGAPTFASIVLLTLLALRRRAQR